MRFQSFRELIDQIYEILELDGADEVTDTAHFEYDDIRFVLTETTMGTETSVEYFCEFGEVPKQNREKILTCLLEINFMMPNMLGQKFSIDSDTGNVVLGGVLGMGTLAALDVLNMFAHHADQAKLWRITYFLHENDPLRGQGGGHAAAKRLLQKTPNKPH
jgi:hypothetical protein